MSAEAERIARSMPKDARRCILNWGDGKTPIPDSVWHGEYSHLKQHAPGSAVRFVLNPLGREVRNLLAAQSDTHPQGGDSSEAPAPLGSGVGSEADDAPNLQGQPQ